MLTNLLSVASDLYIAGKEKAREVRHMGYSPIASGIAAVHGAFEQAVYEMQFHPHARPMPVWAYTVVLTADTIMRGAMSVECETRLLLGLELPVNFRHHFQMN